jgi:hypothetical protein
MNVNKNNYILSFVVQGVSIFITDIHVDVYKNLKVLFLIDDGLFKQYFTKAKYKETLNRGLEFYKDKNAFTEYEKDLRDHCNKFKTFFEMEIKGKENISLKTTKEFFRNTVKLCKDYTKMNVEFTDKAYAEQRNNPVLKKNLSGMAKFKDFIRSFMNLVLFEPNNYISEFFKILGKQFKINPNYFDDLTQSEILALYDGKKLLFTKTSKRQKAFAINYDRSFCQGLEAKKIITLFNRVVGNNKLF